MRKFTISVLTAALLMGGLAGCTSNPYTGESQAAKSAKYGGFGALGGAAVGALVGGKKGALIGAAVGGASGAGYGYYTDVQEKKLADQLRGTGVQLQREGDTLHLIMPGNITFNTAQSDIASSFYPVLKSIATSLKEYNTSSIVVIGHTDNTGTFEKNQVLSEKRAYSVANYFISEGITQDRVQAVGYGPRQPIADNGTEEGRQTNRRVEIQIINKQQQ
jgi:outer membrane protein OmpA-like peptidoglycan-associated protein